MLLLCVCVCVCSKYVCVFERKFASAAISFAVAAATCNLNSPKSDKDPQFQQKNFPSSHLCYSVFIDPRTSHFIVISTRIFCFLSVCFFGICTVVLQQLIPHFKDSIVQQAIFVIDVFVSECYVLLIPNIANIIRWQNRNGDWQKLLLLLLPYSIFSFRH